MSGIVKTDYLRDSEELSAFFRTLELDKVYHK